MAEHSGLLNGKLGRAAARLASLRKNRGASDPDAKGRPGLRTPGQAAGELRAEPEEVKPGLDFLSLFGKLNLDVTEVFKTKGDLKRWSAKRTIGGLIAVTACNDIVTNGISWPAVVLCAISIIPLVVSLLEE